MFNVLDTSIQCFTGQMYLSSIKYCVLQYKSTSKVVFKDKYNKKLIYSLIHLVCADFLMK